MQQDIHTNDSLQFFLDNLVCLIHTPRCQSASTNCKCEQPLTAIKPVTFSWPIRCFISWAEQLTWGVNVRYVIRFVCYLSVSQTKKMSVSHWHRNHAWWLSSVPRVNIKLTHSVTDRSSLSTMIHLNCRRVITNITFRESSALMWNSTSTVAQRTVILVRWLNWCTILIY